MFKENENDFRNNSTKEERHRLDEFKADEHTMMHSIKNQSTPISENESKEEAETESEEEIETTTVTQLPLSSTTSVPAVKKGKYLELMPPGEDNMNSSLPNSPEVWALASMREVETRKQLDDDVENLNNSSSDVELLNGNMMNNSVKSLLDFSEIVRLDNNTSAESANASMIDDVVTAENKEVTFSTAAASSSTAKSTIEDNRIELEHENVEFIVSNKNKSKAVISKIDTELFESSSDLSNSSESTTENSQEDNFKDDVELIAPLNNRNDNGMSKQNEKITKVAESDVLNETTTTQSSEKFTTPAYHGLDEEATTIESAETTTSSIDSSTLLPDSDSDEMENGGDVFKRTITEMPDPKTEEFTTVTTQMPSTTVESTTSFSEVPTTVQTTTEQPKTTTTIQEINTRSTLVTKSISIRIATTTTEHPEDIFTTFSDSNEAYSTAHSHAVSSEHYDYQSTSSPTVEITDDDKFKYSTLLPEVSTTIGINTQDSVRSGKNGGVEGTSVNKDAGLNKESLDGEGTGSNVAIISISISVVVFLLLVAGGFVSILKLPKFKQVT